MSGFSVTVAEYSRYLEESYIVRPWPGNQRETLFQPSPSTPERGKVYLIESLKGSVHGQLALLLLGLQQGGCGHSSVVEHLLLVMK